mgnify:FL=1
MIKCILAIDENGGIGKGGSLPWPANKEDLKQFRDKTTNHIVVMGSKTWEDPFMPAPLKNRDNVVISSRNDFIGAQVINKNIIDELLKLDNVSDKDVWIIGGSTIIGQTIDIIDEIHLTRIPGDFGCDTFIDIDCILGEFHLTESKDNTYFIYNRDK